MNKKVQSLTDLSYDEKNANAGTPRGAALLKQSLEEAGAGRSIVVDRDGRVIAGNKTLEAARSLGLPIVVVETQGDSLVVVQRTDLDLEDDDGQKARRLAYLDNRTGEVGLSWDAAQIAADLEAGLDLDDLFEAGEMAAILERAATGMIDVPEWKEYDESVADEVEYITCPECGHKWPK